MERCSHDGESDYVPAVLKIFRSFREMSTVYRLVRRWSQTVFPKAVDVSLNSSTAVLMISYRRIRHTVIELKFMSSPHDIGMLAMC